jgi:hypothetical protein
MIRELVEIVSDSALRTAPSRPIVYRSVGDTTRFGWFYRRRFVGKNLEGDPDSTSLPQTLAYPIADVRGGYLFKEGRDWFIQPAARHHGESFTRCDERHVPRAFTTVNRHFAAWVKPAARTPHRHHDGKLTLIDPRTEASVQGRDGENAAPGGMVPGWLVRTDGVGNRKHMHLVVHAPDDEAKPIPIPRGIKQAYEDDASMQRDPNRPGRFPPRPGTQGPPEPSGHWRPR